MFQTHCYVDWKLSCDILVMHLKEFQFQVEVFIFQNISSPKLKTRCMSIRSRHSAQMYLQSHSGNGFFLQCLPFRWTTLRGKHWRHLIDVMEVVNTFGQ